MHIFYSSVCGLRCEARLRDPNSDNSTDGTPVWLDTTLSYYLSPISYDAVPGRYPWSLDLDATRRIGGVADPHWDARRLYTFDCGSEGNSRLLNCVFSSDSEGLRTPCRGQLLRLPDGDCGGLYFLKSRSVVYKLRNASVGEDGFNHQQFTRLSSGELAAFTECYNVTVPADWQSEDYSPERYTGNNFVQRPERCVPDPDVEGRIYMCAENSSTWWCQSAAGCTVYAVRDEDIPGIGRAINFTDHTVAAASLLASAAPDDAAGIVWFNGAVIPRCPLPDRLRKSGVDDTLLLLFNARSPLRFGTVRAKFNVVLPESESADAELEELLRLLCLKETLAPAPPAPAPAPIRQAGPTLGVRVVCRESRTYSLEEYYSASGSTEIPFDVGHIRELMEEHGNCIEDVRQALQEEAEEETNDNPPDMDDEDHVDYGDREFIDSSNFESDASLRLDDLRAFIDEHDLYVVDEDEDEDDNN